jgi:hypothetical protein
MVALAAVIGPDRHIGHANKQPQRCLTAGRRQCLFLIELYNLVFELPHMAKPQLF